MKFSILMAMALAFFTLQVQACPAGEFDFSCRGGHLAMGVYEQSPAAAQVTVSYQHNVRASGSFGELLTPGTCSWGARPMTLTEPFAFQTEVYSDHLSTSIENNLMLACSRDSSCTMHMCAHITNAAFIHASNGSLSTFYPTFQ